MNDKELIIQYLKEFKFLDNIYLGDETDVKDYNDFIGLYHKWCNFIECSINYVSLYYFLLEAGEIFINKNSSNTVFLKIKIAEIELGGNNYYSGYYNIYDYEHGTFFHIIYDKLIDLGYDKL